MSTESEVHIFASMTAKPGHEDEMRDVLTRLVAAIEQESGVVHYALHEDTARPGVFHFFEAYEDEAAADAHMASPHLAKAFRTLQGLLDGEVAIARTRLVAG